MNGDIFSAGVMLFALLTGYFPFHNTSQEKIFIDNKKAIVIFKANPWREISVAAKNLVQRMLLKDPN